MAPAGVVGSFFGRESELWAIDERFLAGAPLVTLVGPPGVGKTRLAQQWLAQQRGETRFVNAAPCQSMGELLLEVGAALAAPMDDADELGRALAALGPVVVVLDNVEHLVRDAATVVGRLVGRARVLSTSREPLRVAGEALVAIAPLPETLAVELFVERARAAAPDVTELDREAVRAIVARVDRIPLAIELAAARCGILGPADLLARLDERFALLGGAEGARFATLEHAIAWSWNLLSAVEQQALAQCTVFAGAFSASDAEAVLRLEGGAILDVLQRLHDRSLLFARSLAGTRRLALYESVREFARLRSVDSELTAAELRHAEHCVAEAEAAAAELDASGAPAHRRRLAEIHHDLVAVHQRLGLGVHSSLAARALLAALPTLLDHGPLEEAVRLATRAAELSDGALRARAELATCETLRRRGLLGEALEHLSLARAGVQGSPPLEARVELAEATLRRELGEHEVAFASADAALEIAEQSGDSVLAARAQLLIATLFLQLQHEDTDERCADALERCRASGHRRDEALALTVCAFLAHDHGEHDDAERKYQGALALWRELDEPRSASAVLASFAYVDAALGRLDRASERAAEACALAQRVGDRRIGAFTEASCGLMAALRGDVRQAEERLDAARSLLAPCGDTTFTEVVALCAAAPALARAEQHEGGQHFAAAQRAIETAQSPRARGDDAELPLASRSLDARFVLQLIVPRARALGDAPPPSSLSPKLEVGTDGLWFRMRGRPRIGMAHRPILASVLRVLARERDKRPGSGVNPDDLFSAAWQGERAVRKARAARVYVAISSLRKLGLGDALRRTHEGYLLDPTIPLVLDPS